MNHRHWAPATLVGLAFVMLVAGFGLLSEPVRARFGEAYVDLGGVFIAISVGLLALSFVAAIYFRLADSSVGKPDDDD